MSSCGIYSKVSIPKCENKNLAGKDIELPDSSVMPVPSWDEIFTDVKLQTLIHTALDSNSNLATARLSIDQAERMLKASRLMFAPSFMLSPQGSISSFDGAAVSSSFSLALTTSWELDIFGKLRNSKEQAKSVLEQSKSYVQMVKTQLVATVSTSYYSLLMLDEQLLITKESAVTLEKTLEVIKSLKEAGLQNDAAVRQASANHQNVLISAQELEKQIRMLENALSLLLNQAPSTIERGNIAGINLEDSLNNSISLLALSNRPDVRYSEMQLSQSFYGVNFARSSMYPSIKLSGSVGWTNNLGVIVNPAGVLLSAVASLVQPLFMAGVNKANLDVAKSKYEQQLISFETTLLEAGNEVNNALIECETATKKKELRSIQVNDLYYAVEVTKDLMKSGQASYLEVLIAQNSLLMSRVNQTTDWFEYAKGRINLYKSLGGGF